MPRTRFLRAVCEAMLGIPLGPLTCGEVQALIEGRASAREIKYHERAALQAMVLAEMLGFQAAFWTDAEGLEQWQKEGPTAELFYQAWTGQLDPKDEEEKTFYTPELEGEEIELN